MKKTIRKDRIVKFLKNSLVHKITILIVFLVILNLLFPTQHLGVPVLKEGNIAGKDYIAPYTFAIRKSNEELEEERRQAMESVTPIFRLDEGVRNESMQRLSTFFQRYERVDSLMTETPEENKEDLRKLAEDIIIQILDRGLVEDLSIVYFGSKREAIVLKKTGEEKRVEILDVKSAIMFTKERGMELLEGNEEKVMALVEIVNKTIIPNLIYMKEETDEKRRLAVDNVKTTKGVVLKGEMIARAHDPITKEAIEKLSSLAIETGGERVNTEIFGRNIIFILSILVLLVLLYFLNRYILFDTKRLLLIAIIYLLLLSSASLVVRSGISVYVIPIAMASVFFAILIGEKAAMASCVPLSFLLAMFIGFGRTEALFCFPVAITTVFVASRIKKFSDFSKVIPFVTVISVVVACGFEIYKGGGYKVVLNSLGFAAIGGISSGVLAVGLLPLFERGFRITTDLTLVELTDLNHPLLKALSIQTPGTYNHSILIASMVESIASSISANSLLARAGAYYHDIGKLKNPLYFIENQKERGNPHDTLRPKVSSTILRMHVKDGIERAKREGLPEEIIDIIREHHGRTLMESLYYKAKEEDPNVSEDDFRYGGPSPNTKEAALVMLADAVEASIRSLKNPTAVRIKEQIDRIIDKRVKDGELDNCDITQKDLKNIRDSFYPILLGVFHPRVSYPQESNQGNNKLKGKNYS
ncbi:HDIG domain-containing protein [candidate division WOR-3 bacterium]|nr:HDIG domain-containing protein [candidate division WOR-3 bacterium]